MLECGLFLLGLAFNIASGNGGFYNIAHMTNTPDTAQWAVDQGANGVEIDLSFSATTGKAEIFRHSAEGEACDCSCICPAPVWKLCERHPKSVCAHLLNDVHNMSPCRAESSVPSLLSQIASLPQIALVIIDSKIDKKTMSRHTMVQAGKAVVASLDEHLFKNGYRGKVVIGTPTLDTFRYLQSAADAARSSHFSNRIYFTIDLEKNNIIETLRTLHTLPTKNIVYGTGISACAPASTIKRSTMELAAVNRVRGVVGLSYLWTVDKTSTIKNNIPFVNGILSNYPGKVHRILMEKEIQLATYNSIIPTATSNNVITDVTSIACDCDYHPGGCSISKAAPAGMACHCHYKGWWTCGGLLALCSNPGSRYCKHPDTSIYSCLLGGGDCKGY